MSSLAIDGVNTDHACSVSARRMGLSAPLFVFSGIDGAGKTTQIERFLEMLRRAGHRPQLIWSRGGYTPGMNFLKLWMRRICGRKVPPPGSSAERDAAFAHGSTRRWWLRLAIVDLAIYYGVWIRLLRWTGRAVVCDRYWQDTLLDFQTNFSGEQVERWMLWRIFVRVCPQPTGAILLLIPVDESVRRCAQKDEPFPATRDILTRRHAEYEIWATNGEWHVMNGMRSINEIAEEIQRLPCVSACC